MCETIAQRLRAYDSGKGLWVPSLWVRGSGAARLVALLSSHVADKSVLPGGVRPQLLTTGAAPQGCSGVPCLLPGCLLPAWMIREQDGSGSVFITLPQKSRPLLLFRVGRGHPGGWLPHLGSTRLWNDWKGFSFSERAYPWFPSEYRKKDKVGRGGWTKEN